MSNKIILNETFWSEEKEKGIVLLGFNKKALVTLGQIWMFLPRIKVGASIVRDQAIATVETTYTLRSITSPIAGVMKDMNYKMFEKPEDILDETALFTVKVTNALSGL